MGSSAGDPEETTLEQVTVPFVLFVGMHLIAIAIFVKEFKFKLKIV